MANVEETRVHKIFWQQNVLQCRHVQNKQMEDNIKMHGSDIGITGVNILILHVTVTISFMTWRQGTSREKSDSTDLGYNLNM